MQPDISTHYVEKIYESIKWMVINYEIMPDQKIDINQLSEQLHVSCTPVREALNQLLKENLVVRGTRRGFYNRSIDLHEFQDLVVLRSTLTAGAVRLMFRTASTAAIDGLVQHWRQCSGAERLRNEHLQPLYNRILQLADNSEMLYTHDKIMERMSYLWMRILVCSSTQNRYFRFQSRLVSAIAARNVAHADTAIQNATLFEAKLSSELVKQSVLQLYTQKQNRKPHRHCDLAPPPRAGVYIKPSVMKRLAGTHTSSCSGQIT